ncbi:hypothetical protein I3843_10G062600 [Carya illinoinensis]|nr:hypothetical protein I3843_10G062600 [Carya illinoinensis]
MEFDKEQHGVPGSVPEYGAIFMLSSATKRECFRQRLVGLPASLGHFVKHVKAGMILFLFEYEKRKLHGVFRACSDGAENIVPHAFQSSRKQFPAQVKFTPIWSCSPLIEAEFRDAIKENYFSAKKFNFGLSEEQVHRLLCLFSLRKVTDDLPQRRPNKLKVAGACTMGKVVRYDDGGVLMSDEIKYQDYSDDYHRLVVSTDDTRKSSGRIGREHDEGKFAKIHEMENKPEVYTELGPVTLDEYFGDSLANVGRDGGRFAMCERTGSECTLSIERGHVMLNDYSGLYLGTVGQVPDHGRFAKTNRLECEHDMDKEFVPPFPTKSCTVSQPNLHRSIYSNKVIWETDSVVQDQIGTHSTFSGSSEPQISYPLPSTLGGDAIGTSTHPFDPDLPGINSSYSSSSAIDRSSHSFQECAPPYRMHAGNLIPSPKNQSCFLSIGPNCMKRCPDDSSGFGNHVPFSTPKSNEDFNYRTSLPFSGASNSESLATEFSGNQSFEGLSFSWCPAALTLSETGNNGTENKGLPSYSSSPSIYPFDYSFPVESQGKHEHEGVRREEKNKPYTSNIPLLNDGQVLLHGFDCSLEHNSLRHHEPKSLNHDRNFCSYSENMPSICEKSRNSVFSRLASSSYVREQGNGDDVGHEERHGDKLADDVMAMLHQSRCRWAKIKKYGIYPSPNFGYSFPVESQGKLEDEVFQHENEAFAGNIPLSNESQVQLNGHDYSLKRWDMYHHDSKSLNHDVNCYQYSENVSSGGEKSRNSVFSRLALASDVYVKENADVGHRDFDGDKSADEVMTMLPQSSFQSSKPGKPRLSVKRYDVENFGNKKKSTFYPKLERDCQEMNLKEMKMNITSTENVNQTHVEGTPVDFKNLSAGGIPYRDFKRRSEVWKIHNDSKGRVCDEIAGSDGLSGEQCKRRKLIRPNFSKSMDVLQQENSVKSKDKTRSCEELVGSEDKENKLSQSVKKLHVIGPISGENKNIDTDVERGSNCVGEPKAGNCKGFFRLECENGKGSSQDALECEDKKASSQEAGIHNAC